MKREEKHEEEDERLGRRRGYQRDTSHVRDHAPVQTVGYNDSHEPEEELDILDLEGTSK